MDPTHIYIKINMSYTVRKKNWYFDNSVIQKLIHMNKFLRMHFRSLYKYWKYPLIAPTVPMP